MGIWREIVRNECAVAGCLAHVSTRAGRREAGVLMAFHATIKAEANIL